MKLHEFYGIYANIPLSGENNRFVKRKFLDWDKSPDDIYKQLKECEEKIAFEKDVMETLLKVADEIMPSPPPSLHYKKH